jgi:hypothetical protein
MERAADMVSARNSALSKYLREHAEEERNHDASGPPPSAVAGKECGAVHVRPEPENMITISLHSTSSPMS